MSGITLEKVQVKQKISIFVLFMLVVSYLFYNFLLLPQWNKKAELTAQLRIEEQQVKVVEAFILAHPNTEQYLLELDRNITKVDMMLPDNPDVSRFLLDIEQLSRECGVQLKYLKPGNVTNKDGYREIDMEFSISGNFIQVMNFINKAENGLRFINVTSIGMKVEKNTLESKLVAKIYSYGTMAAPPINQSKGSEVKK